MAEKSKEYITNADDFINIKHKGVVIVIPKEQEVGWKMMSKNDKDKMALAIRNKLKAGTIIPVKLGDKILYKDNEIKIDDKSL